MKVVMFQMYQPEATDDQQKAFRQKKITQEIATLTPLPQID
jgi:hypothetical protein